MNYEIDDDSENLFIKELLERYIAHWRLFIVSLVICFVIGFFYLRYTPKMYRATSTILIKSENNGAMSELSAFEDLSIFKNAKREVENEIEILKSRPLLENVVRKLHLNVQYFSKTKYSKRFVELTKNSPVKVKFLEDSYYDQGLNFIITILPGEQFAIKDTHENFILKGEYGKCIGSPFGDILVEPDFKILHEYIGTNIYVNSTPLLDMVERYKSTIKIGLTDQNTSVVTLTLTTIAQDRAKEILNSLIEEYNKDVIKDKNQISANTANFIKERIHIINQELDDLEKNVEFFKTENNLTNLSSEASIMLEKSFVNEKEQLAATIQIGLTDYLMDYLENSKNDLLPVNLGFEDRKAVTLISRYNDIALQRNRILKSSGVENPLLISLNDKLFDLRKSIQQSLINLKKTLQLKIDNLKSSDAIVNAQISSLPEKERKLRDIQRQQQIKETLFLYLLEKREETAISLAATVSNVKVIEKAYISRSPIRPKKNIVFLTGFLAALIVPIVIVFFKDLMNTKVNDIKELKKKLKLPLLGSIPSSPEDKKLVTPKADRSILAEAFRLLETNLDFLLAHSKEKGKTILITSSIKGEGKSFAASNLGITLGRSGNKVALLEMDLRSAELKERMDVDGKKGITNFIRDESIQIEDIMSNMKGFKNLDVFTSGPKPPNPAELLKHKRIEELFEYLKKEYDYILIDTPPITVVADTLLLSSYADLCVYVVRQKFSDKRLLDIPKTLNQEKRFTSIAVLFNDVDFRKIGYGYGYGYGYGERSKAGFFKRMLNLMISR
ncbi:capsular exopolysaccharide synthesis family protein [Aquimarina sp. EL_43]|uniref:GumC family protein n=1 Tax=unclassified Aquimarina TaxID=2627091 RepID=UPI0018CB0FD3|nr:MULTISPECIES: tyrosine-protein kinase [unclassified Aquimarina]MBG6128708.1 capsular exopolysaccharide synthesis family protein [Aquimarina sp. EL_35]MBG6149771.1 capsular exopolysaccharide synthesis family protein [Aquimarina sp. EL_32]MBG6167543.1 capsular exopolysaccharide synthesis family protein [Aquimarina sp. EL_43]